MNVRWYVCDLVTGRILDELPLTGVDKVRRRIALVETTTFNLPVRDKKCPPQWHANLVPGRTMLVLTLDDAPTQAWFVTDITIGDDLVPIPVSTLEECLSRTNVPEFDPYGLDYSDVAVALVAPVQDRYGFSVEYATSAKTFTADQTYSTLEDRTVLVALNEDIMGSPGGPEWRTFVRWADDTHRAFTKVIEIRPRVGQNRPDAIFDLDVDGRGTIESYTRTISYAAGKGATLLIGTSDGSGESRPMTDPQISPLVAQGWPAIEERKAFTGLDDAFDPDAELLARTQALLAQRQLGSTTWQITGRDNAPRAGIDYQEGDTVLIQVAPRPPVDPTGGTTSSRVLGWELDVVSGQATPLLWESEDDDG